MSQIPVFLLIFFFISKKISFQSHLSSQEEAFSNVKLQTASFLFPSMSHRDKIHVPIGAKSPRETCTLP